MKISGNLWKSCYGAPMGPKQARTLEVRDLNGVWLAYGGFAVVAVCFVILGTAGDLGAQQALMDVISGPVGGPFSGEPIMVLGLLLLLGLGALLAGRLSGLLCWCAGVSGWVLLGGATSMLRLG
ncbi:MAG: hypothetical protein ACI9HE_004028 [Planctomycetota bacterium]